MRLGFVFAMLVVLAWWLPNRQQNPAPGPATDKFDSLSFAPFRARQSPLTGSFPTEAQADQDMALLATRTGAVRTYAAIGGDYDAAKLAQRHGLRLWQGIWLGGDRAQNAREIAHAIALAHQYPKTIDRVIVGNEVLLRRDLPPAELIADIDQVRAAITQPVAYADVWTFWEQFPQIARHVDIVLIHLLPYWEDTPTGNGRAVAYVGQVYDRMAALFPNKRVAIGETGWPSRGRQRRDAIPGRVAETKFVRQFIALSQAHHFEYNLIEAFDQDWKYANEGVVGANWGLFTDDRQPKIPLTGPLRETPFWAWDAAASILLGMLLAAFGLGTHPGAAGRRRQAIVAAGMALGAALGFAAAATAPVLYDGFARVAGVANLAGQTVLAMLAMARLGLPRPARTGAHTTQAVRNLLLLRGLPRDPAILLEDLAFLFVWAAAVDQLLLVFDPRYRDFPLPAYAVPLLLTLWRPVRGWGAEGWLAGGALVGGALASLVQEGWLNGQSLQWNFLALLFGVVVMPPAARALPWTHWGLRPQTQNT